jgi:aminobenzoyl-glutamate transport protein
MSVLIPLAGVIFAAAGRHPIAGIAAAFAGVSGGFSANLLPGQLDALLFGITQAAVEAVFGPWQANIAGNWYFIVGMTVIFLPVIWFVTDRIVEPRLGRYVAPAEPERVAAGHSPAAGEAFANEAAAAGVVADEAVDAPLTSQQRKGLGRAGLAVLGVVALWGFFTLGPGTPLIDEAATPEARLTPFYQSLVAGFFLLFLLSGWAYGAP